MFRYRTEIVVPSDRYVWLKLPDAAPEGPAVVSVVFLGESPNPASHDLVAVETPPGGTDERDKEDIEWWEEFDDELADG